MASTTIGNTGTIDGGFAIDRFDLDDFGWVWAVVT